MAKMFSTPILFIIFNRPDTTVRVFERLRELKPTRLFVAADGPRPQKAGEAEHCAQARAIIDTIDWPCEVTKRFSNVNQGCKVGVSSAITWFFENVEEGIILEDDCLPEPSFFSFCAELLEKYRNDFRVMEIGGTQYLKHPVQGNASYYFSQLTQIWGWATWRRAWKTYDSTIANYPQALEHHTLESMFRYPKMREFWQRKFDLAYRNGIDTWDIQWQFLMSSNNGLAIIPKKNLVSNIGFDINATHTHDSLHSLANRPTEPLINIVHPTFVMPELKVDYRTFRKFISPNKLVKLWGILRRWYSMSRKKHE
jgi:hypothetical protein